ncbi:hypothetical protein EVAR_99082_1 [Eumeta japonica]|uniref:Uncharacterized protein n=1 Tax=Eumeta variegata TaxID=151549 RepID=A0A4C1ZK78_EUMVA|nr:hypothetical protein EVAR_99082_1 [Eumeta japonica]
MVILRIQILRAFGWRATTHKPSVVQDHLLSQLVGLRDLRVFVLFLNSFENGKTSGGAGKFLSHITQSLEREVLTQARVVTRSQRSRASVVSSLTLSGRPS